jgi:hypothetical protein
VYDPSTETTLKGSAASVELVAPAGRRAGGVHVRLSAGDQATEVHLGPSWFLDRRGVKVAKGDALEVTGSLVTLDGTEY